RCRQASGSDRRSTHLLEHRRLKYGWTLHPFGIRARSIRGPPEILAVAVGIAPWAAPKSGFMRHESVGNGWRQRCRKLHAVLKKPFDFWDGRYLDLRSMAFEELNNHFRWKGLLSSSNAMLRRSR